MRRLSIAVVLLVPVAVGFGPAWAGPLVADPAVPVSGASPFAACGADDVAGQPGTNFPGSEVEPWLAVNENNPLHMVAGWQQDRWSNGGARGLVAARSIDGGATWSPPAAIPEIVVCSGGNAANGGDFQRATDPWITIAPNGDVYFFSLSLDIETPLDRPGGFGKNAMLVSKSTDGGLTFGPPITLIRDENPKFLNDKNAITADPFDSALVYAVWDRLELPLGTVINPENVIGLGFKGPVYFSRTTDGGQTWERAREIYNPGGNNQTIGNQIVVLPNGTLVNFFNEILNFRNDDGGGRFEYNLSLIRSTDKGATWTRGRAIRATKMQTLALFRAFGVVDPEDPTNGVRTEDVIPEVAVDRTGSAAHGTLYAVWQDARFSGFNRDEIAFAQSTDGGLTWSTPIKINQTAASGPSDLNAQAFTPSVHVAADGTIGVTYYDFRNNDSGTPALETDYFIVHCHPTTPTTCANPANWGTEVQLTDASFDMRQAPVARGFFVGDYEGLDSATGNGFGALFSVQDGLGETSIFFRRVAP